MWSGDSADTSLDLEPYLVVQLESGWRHDPESGVFLRGEGPEEEVEAFDPAPQLPEATRIEPMVPSLAESDSEALSEPEAELARYLHLFPGAGADLDELLETISGWSCVARTYKPPRVALP